MMISSIKNGIQLSFNSAFKTYDDHAYVQREVCEQLLMRLKKIVIQVEIIADFACGTGISTQGIADIFCYRNLYAIDFCNNLLMRAKNKLKSLNVEFILADFENHIFLPNSLDLIFCNMGFQWALNLKRTLFVLFSQLKPFGILAFSVPLVGTFCELRNICRNSFLTAQLATYLLQYVGFELLVLDKKTFVDSFKSPRDAIRSIKFVGANYLLQPRENKGLSSILIKNMHDTTLTYQVGFFIAKKIVR